MMILTTVECEAILTNFRKVSLHKHGTWQAIKRKFQDPDLRISTGRVIIACKTTKT
jgi:hypothetical protein